jgi:hypothetical protein
LKTARLSHGRAASVPYSIAVAPFSSFAKTLLLIEIGFVEHHRYQVARIRQVREWPLFNQGWSLLWIKS